MNPNTAKLFAQIDEAIKKKRGATVSPKLVRGCLVVLASLASKTPQFFNPLDELAAQELRDNVLEWAKRG